MSLYASVCSNTVVMWPLFIELIVSFCKKITRKIYVTQGKLRENTGNFILARMWPPSSTFLDYVNPIPAELLVMYFTVIVLCLIYLQQKRYIKYRDYLKMCKKF